MSADPYKGEAVRVRLRQPLGDLDCYVGVLEFKDNRGVVLIPDDAALRLVFIPADMVGVIEHYQPAWRKGGK